MKALVGAFNQEKALVGAFSVIVQPVVEPMDRCAALVQSGEWNGWLIISHVINYYHYMMEAETAAQQTDIHISNPPNVAILLLSPANILIL